MQPVCMACDLFFHHIHSEHYEKNIDYKTLYKTTLLQLEKKIRVDHSDLLRECAE